MRTISGMATARADRRTVGRMNTHLLCWIGLPLMIVGCAHDPSPLPSIPSPPVRIEFRPALDDPAEGFTLTRIWTSDQQVYLQDEPEWVLADADLRANSVFVDLDELGRPQ